MSRRFCNGFIFLSAALGAVALAATNDPTATTTGLDDTAPGPGLHFSWVDVYLDSGAVPLAAYQLELSAAEGAFRIVGIEGGEHPAFAQPPFYDPAALANDRVILAAFSTDDELPTGRTRVARVHVSFQTVPLRYATELIVAASADGGEIKVTAETQGADEP